MSALEDLYAFLDDQGLRDLKSGLIAEEGGNSQQSWESKVAEKIGGRKATGSEFFAMTGGRRIDAGMNTGDIPMKDAGGAITGYAPRARSAGGLTPGLDRLHAMQSEAKAGAPLSTASATPGLTAFHEMNPEQMGPPAALAGIGGTVRGRKNPLIVTKQTPLPASNPSGQVARTADMVQRIFS